MRLTVARGETVCIIGANWAGKTTLFNAITGMVKPSAGEIVFNGESVAEHAPHVLARLGLGRTFQIPRPFESMTVWENILLAADSVRGRANAVEHAAWVVRTLHLEDSCAGGDASGRAPPAGSSSPAPSRYSRTLSCSTR